MKIILSGCTGLVGREVLNQCIANSSITSIVALTRDAVIADNPKVKVAFINDFLEYPEGVIQDIHGAESCIWSLGNARMPENAQTAHKESVEYTRTAAAACRQAAAGKRFRFVYLSGGLVGRDPTKTLWLSRLYRQIRADGEDVLRYAESDTFESYIVRPDIVFTGLAGDESKNVTPTVRVDVLAKAMINAAIHGHVKRVFDDEGIKQLSNGV
ncbi:hypothetical protein ASPWEDRAFT_62778 [Aspergillus wentii DTO 134E9]|uniref:Uncharacterized protein n=1 Tax=Aspergillus wentii DTO 134E9 TaxID=1073089 RepID=A0A1L9R5B2_ASPWE|nr:uncharacterized protein ASPWEDRAFT_62778 [Aspergillus wentii DTO 134E9]KAI9923724.1 hypothetical protein MW887_008351 [Aspergillus wentii]OJJ30077.1 hypothetical protein ASPWEDRAFT_62778 [Aspergillus wentii DTO 134E9]